LLALSPLLRARLIEKEGLIVNSASGVSGAGRTPGSAPLFSETSEGLRPYKVAGAHRHTPEIEQELSLMAGTEIRVLLTPQLVPMNRGILTVAYGRAARGATADAMRESARDLFREGLVTVLDDGVLPDTVHVRGSARAHVGYAVDERTGLVLAMCAQDNLARGASAQAVQAFNVARRWPDSLGLPEIGLFP
jgi:N-acetyl-gamma-glutamyl-phosphate reductase